MNAHLELSDKGRVIKEIDGFNCNSDPYTDRSLQTVKTNNGYEIYVRGNYDRGKIVVNLGYQHGHHLLVSSFIQ